MSDKTETIRLQAPFSEREARKLKSGPRVLLSGVIYSLRDAGHKRLVELVECGKEPPFPLIMQYFTTLILLLQKPVAL